ncbi:FGGY-family carbohydrate kinase [Leptolyngbya cf. ectocarpi LEGE 11479]|uniref:D-ribulose kinase n=1 Tax=Leptolyngbya cf. ectocarpi LEGE 11479 TaxID=1828722 RepID=A0A928ZPL1_LEPEC|nr:FGGY-family carbohydrate kinase [Leptolyngbya ectocarpi]MBE9065320.1 FGGY-family carbohydrate kinase [Leptolyngbya cf. ectocarpi LEGE 11479]
MTVLESFYLGIDFGTSGARAIAIDSLGQIIAETRCQYRSDAPNADDWKHTLWTLLDQIPGNVRHQIGAISINGTSATVLLCDRNHRPLTPPLLYNDARGGIPAVAPVSSPAHSATSSLAKALWWLKYLPDNTLTQAQYLVHQADWLSSLLHGHPGISDYNNALKLGYDPQHLTYPDWLQTLEIGPWLPRVLAPGDVIAPIQPEVAQRFNISPTCLIKAGTTDSIAAFLASGASRPGDGVTSLGSTLVLKLLSPIAINDTASGVYSHRLGQQWLVGGASNTGGAVLRYYFDDAELRNLSQQIDPTQTSGLDYYPLLTKGERFPINNPQLEPQLSPRPQAPAKFLHGLLEAMARIEALGYQKLMALGSGDVKQVYTAGGGAQNTAWQQLRSQALGIPIVPASHTEAAYGTARLAAGLIQLN